MSRKATGSQQPLPQKKTSGEREQEGPNHRRYMPQCVFGIGPSSQTPDVQRCYPCASHACMPGNVLRCCLQALPRVIRVCNPPGCEKWAGTLFCPVVLVLSSFFLQETDHSGLSCLL